MFKFIVTVIVMATIILPHMVSARPGDLAIDAAENVDVPPEHRAAPPQPPQQHPVQPPYQPRAIFPAAAVPGGPQYPLFFSTPNGFVPFGSIYSAYQPQAIVQNPAFILPQDQPLTLPIVAAV
ncbi:uncharacterized protein LOC111681347 [Lucilia cuprina]|uniref:uncharacterized protein LOC111681347 n=1 Tax=Lucilia cuprina TaxID=7375 RepID=UPI001F05CA9E|nr:uncharacterized protein LOC111681347 [Lucilia cuprina]